MKLKQAAVYVPEKIPDIKKIKECCNNINDEASKYDYCSWSYIHDNLYEIMLAVGAKEDIYGELEL